MSKENIEMVAIARFANWATQHHKDQMVKTMAAPIGSHDFYKNKCEMMSAYLSYIEEQISRPLIAAAPDLLAALERLSFAAECRDNTMGDACRLIEVKAELASANQQARAAIAKATGA